MSGRGQGFRPPPQSRLLRGRGNHGRDAVTTQVEESLRRVATQLCVFEEQLQNASVNGDNLLANVGLAVSQLTIPTPNGAQPYLQEAFSLNEGRQKEGDAENSQDFSLSDGRVPEPTSFYHQDIDRLASQVTERVVIGENPSNGTSPHSWALPTFPRDDQSHRATPYQEYDRRVLPTPPREDETDGAYGGYEVSKEELHNFQVRAIFNCSPEEVERTQYSSPQPLDKTWNSSSERCENRVNYDMAPPGQYYYFPPARGGEPREVQSYPPQKSASSWNSGGVRWGHMPGEAGRFQIQPFSSLRSSSTREEDLQQSQAHGRDNIVAEKLDRLRYFIKAHTYWLENMSPREILSDPNCRAILRNLEASLSILNISEQGNERTEGNMAGNGTVMSMFGQEEILRFSYEFGGYGHDLYTFSEPNGQVYIDDGSYVICDSQNHRLIHYDANHTFVRTIGQHPMAQSVLFGDSKESREERSRLLRPSKGHLYFPLKAALCPLSKNFIVAERPPSRYNMIKIYSFEGFFVRELGGNRVQHPRGITVDRNSVILIIESKVMKLHLFRQSGQHVRSHLVAEHLSFPNDIAVLNDLVLISDNSNHGVFVFDYFGRCMYKIGNEQLTYYPIGVALNADGRVVVTDNHQGLNITVFDISGGIVSRHRVPIRFQSRFRCQGFAHHPTRKEIMITTKEDRVFFLRYNN